MAPTATVELFPFPLMQFHFLKKSGLTGGQLSASPSGSVLREVTNNIPDH